ncbi:hypothetical protein BDD12DRAFT_876364 [Trichophaea hybrida]|nr:hypothetical protein BDD12DRAFT_876364 [Trichophaea hybrida]
MSATSSVRSVSEMLQQPMPEATKRYLDKLAAEINARGQGLTEDDLWIAQGRLKGVPHVEDYAATAKSYPKHKGEPLEKFRPDPEKTLAQQLVVWKHRRDDLLEDREERKKKAKENPNIRDLKRERANLQSSLGPYWSP